MVSHSSMRKELDLGFAAQSIIDCHLSSVFVVGLVGWFIFLNQKVLSVMSSLNHECVMLG